MEMWTTGSIAMQAVTQV